MKKVQRHQRINELLDLISVNNQRMYLRDSNPERIDSDLLKKYVLELYEQVLGLEKDTQESSAPNTDTSLPTVELEVNKAQEPAMKEPDTAQELPFPNETTKAPEVENTFKEENEKVLKDLPLPPDEAGHTTEKAKPESDEKEKSVTVKSLEEKENINPLDTPSEERKKPDEENRFKSDEKQSINEKMMKTGNQKIYEKYHSSAIASIRKSISLMKRFEYQKALFNDNADYYNDALKFFDEAGSADNALQEFNHLASQFDWDLHEDPLVEELRTLIERRYLD